MAKNKGSHLEMKEWIVIIINLLISFVIMICGMNGNIQILDIIYLYTAS